MALLPPNELFPDGDAGVPLNADLYLTRWEVEYNLASVTQIGDPIGITINMIGNPLIKRISGELRYGLSTEFNSNPTLDIFNENTDAYGNLTISFNNLDQDKFFTIRIKTYDKPVGQTGARETPYNYIVSYTPLITNEMLASLKGINYLPDENNDTSIDINSEIKVARSFLTITTDNDPGNISGAIKNTGVQIPTSFTTPAYYQFGTNLVFQPISVESRQAGGIGIFVNNAMNTGYYIVLKTTQASTESSLTDDTFKIIKVYNGNIKELKVTQKYKINTLAGVYAATQYKIDVKVKVQDTGLVDRKGNKKLKTTIRAYVNGRLMEVIDENSGDNENQNALTPTSNISLFSNIGTTNFDYVYAFKDSDNSFFNRPNSYDIYNEKFSSSIVKIAYGDIFVNGIIPDLDSNTPVKYIEEFGPTVREIKKVTSQNEFPSETTFVYSNANSDTKILSYSGTEFESDIYLINTASITNVLDPNTATHISVIGKELNKIDEIIYEDQTLKNYINEEPYIYKSEWIQNEVDAIRLSDFIKNKFSKYRKVIQLQIFANPILQIGDIVSISYAYQDLNGTELFVITSIEQNWQDGLQTFVTLRSIG